MMKTLLSVAVLILVFSAQAQERAPSFGRAESGSLIVPGELIIKFKPEVDVRSLIRTDGRSSYFNGESRPPKQIGQNTILVSVNEWFTVNPSRIDSDLTERTLEAKLKYESHPEVSHVEPVYLAFPFRTPNDELYGSMWHYHARGSGGLRALGGANFAEAWRRTTGSKLIKIAVLDTGILLDEPEFKNSPNILPGADFISNPWSANDNDPGQPDDGTDYDNDPTDEGDAYSAFECSPLQWKPKGNTWHGSHVAGIAGAGNTNNEEGIAGSVWHVSIIPVRVLGRCGGRTDDIASAIRWAAGIPVAGIESNPHGPADIINLSLGGLEPCSNVQATIQDSINEALNFGSITVAAAGNEGIDVSGVFPAGCDNVITVAASDMRGNLTGYSNFGAGVDIMAPGGDIGRDDNSDGVPDGVLSVVKGGYSHYMGTSMAAPHVSGALALLLASDDSLRRMAGPKKLEEVVKRLRNSAVPRTNSECPRFCGAGLLDTGKLVGEVQ